MQSTKSLRYKVQAFAGKAFIRVIELSMKPFLLNKAFFAPTEFNWTKQIDENWIVIRDEIMQVISEKNAIQDICEVSPEQEIVVNHGDWDFFPLLIYGNRIKKNTIRCPKTSQLVESIPNATTVFFSILKPGCHVKAHRGAYRGYLRYHLGLSISEPEKCGLRLIDKTYHWHNGGSMIFDDTYDHEAWNRSDTDRIILYVDFIRPMPAPFVALSKWLTRKISKSPYIQSSLERAGNLNIS